MVNRARDASLIRARCRREVAMARLMMAPTTTAPTAAVSGPGSIQRFPRPSFCPTGEGSRRIWRAQAWMLTVSSSPSDDGEARPAARRLTATLHFVRVGLVCPYSHTLPGGVQNQTLGLARSLRAAGHDARVLGPCDGPPPDGGVTPLGRSVPTAANGSIAPIAPDPSCQLRTIRARRAGGSDVRHLHGPPAPGPRCPAP